MKKMTLGVTGCALSDFLYTDVDFGAEAFRSCASRKRGDGGLTAGELVFADALEKYMKKDYSLLLKVLTNGAAPAKQNLGGPAVVGAINAAQILSDLDVKCSFYGACGKDATGKTLKGILAKTPLDAKNYVALSGPTPATDVLSDPRANNGKGERTFINTIGSAYDYTPEMLPESFFASDIVWIGATALVPPLHNNLTALLKKAKKNGALTVVSTVFDFINEQKNPDKPWPMGDGKSAYKYIDLLLVDWDEARRLSGKEFFGEIMGFFMESGVKAFVITHGAHDFYVWSNGELFEGLNDVTALPVSAKVDEILAADPSKKGDTTGCGDNFAGGFVAGMIRQLAEGVPVGQLDIYRASSWAAASGGFACFTVGGTYLEKKKGEKLASLKDFADAYMKQLNRI